MVHDGCPGKREEQERKRIAKPGNMQYGASCKAERCMWQRSTLRWPSQRAASAIALHCVIRPTIKLHDEEADDYLASPSYHLRQNAVCLPLETHSLNHLQASTARANQLQHLCQALTETRAGPSFLQVPTVNRPKKTAARARPVTSCRRTELLCPSRKDARETHPGTSFIPSIPFPSLTTSQQTLLHTALPSPPFHNERNAEAGFKHKVSEFPSNVQAPARHPEMH